MAVHVDPKSRIFKVDYRAPFGGLDSTAYASAIAEQNFADMEGIYVENNIIKPVDYTYLGNIRFSGIHEHYLGYIPLESYSNDPSVTTTLAGYVISDQNLYPLEADSSGALSLGTAVPYTPAKTAINDYFHYLTIDDIQTGIPSIFWTAGGWNEIWTYDAATSTLSLLTNYCGGGILGLLNNQFLNLGGYSQADGDTPNRISWSAPGEYGQFQPYDVGSGTGNYAAGFNDLPSTSDVLTGFSAIGTVGYIFRYQGITQMSPTGNGIVPFSFNHLWASELGVGGIFPYSISQYGSSVVFASTEGIYTLGLGGLAKIGSAANTYIYSVINNSVSTFNSSGFTNGLKGRLIPYILNSPDLLYVMGIADYIDGTVLYYRCLGVRLSDNSVYDFGDFAAETENNLTNLELNFIPIYELGLTPTTLLNGGTIQLGLFIQASAERIVSGGTQGEVSFFLLNQIPAIGDPPSATGIIAFKKEQFGLLQQPTVSKLLVLGSLIDTSTNGTISWSIDGGLTFNTAFADTVITAGSGNPGNGIIDDIVADGVQTLERPQLVLKLTNVQIAEAYYQGTFADYEPI